MSIKTLALKKAQALGISNIRFDDDDTSQCVVANASAGHTLRVQVVHPDGTQPKRKKGVTLPTVDLPLVKARTWAEMLEILNRTKHVKNGGAS